MGGAVKRGVTWDRVLIDVCTLRDYLDPGAILQVANLDELITHLGQVFRWALEQRIGVVSSIESHRASEPLNGWPLHCIDGTPGQSKPDFTLLKPAAMVETDNYLSLPPDLRKDYRQLIFRKRSRDVLGNPKADRFLTQLRLDEYIIVGVGVERAIKSLALGLLARHKAVAVVTDACGHWSGADAELAFRQLAAKGARLTTAAELTAPPPMPDRHSGSGSRRRRYVRSRLRRYSSSRDPARS